MELNMTASQLIELMNRRPFSTLEIYMADGERIRVEQPYQIATRPNGPVAIVYDSDDRTHFISYRNITQVVTVSGDQNDFVSSENK